MRRRLQRFAPGFTRAVAAASADEAARHDGDGKTYLDAWRDQGDPPDQATRTPIGFTL